MNVDQADLVVEPGLGLVPNKGGRRLLSYFF
jgi:hypothetical protein